MRYQGMTAAEHKALGQLMRECRKKLADGAGKYPKKSATSRVLWKAYRALQCACLVMDDVHHREHSSVETWAPTVYLGES